MNTWLKLLEIDMADIQPEQFDDPGLKVGKKDHRVGVASDGIKRLYTIKRRVAKEAELKVVELRFSEGNDQQLRSRVSELKSKSEVLDHLFWTALREEFDLWDKESIGIRAGYVVVWNNIQSPLEWMADHE